MLRGDRCNRGFGPRIPESAEHNLESIFDEEQSSGRIIIDAQEKLEIIRDLLEEKKALDIEVIGLEGRTLIADYFIICTGTSNTHIKGLADALLVDGKVLGLKKHHAEGYTQAKWVLVDYSDVIVHIFAQEERDFYDIESLWKQTESLIRLKEE